MSEGDGNGGGGNGGNENNGGNPPENPQNANRFGALLRPPAQFNMDVEDKSLAWKRWIRQFRFFAAASGLGNEPGAVQVGTLMTCLGEGVLDLYDTFVFENGQENDIEIVIQKIEEIFKLEAGNETQERQIFYAIKQGSRSFNDFYSDLQIQAKKCNFGDTQSSMIRDQIIKGVRENSTREKLHMKRDLNLVSALEICRTQERLKVLMKEASGTSKEVDVVKKDKKTQFKAKKFESKGSDSKSSKSCEKCGREHEPKKCPAYGSSCFVCKGKNHYARCCPKKKSKDKSASTVEFDDEEEISLVNLRLDTIGDSTDDWFQDLWINNKKLTLKLDTGAQCNVVSRETAIKLGFEKIQKSITKRLISFNNVKTPVLGEFVAECQAGKDQEPVKVKFKVIDNPIKPILGRESCVKLNLIKRIEQLQVNDEIFEGLGCLKDFSYKLEFKEKPEFEICPARPVPHAIKADVKKEIDNMVKWGVIEKVEEPTPAVCNMVISRRNGKTRVCLDPSNVNKNLLRRHYPLKTVEQIAVNLKGSKFFTKLDCRNCYWQFKIHKDSQNYLVFITPWGRFRYLRMPQGISSGPEVCQNEFSMLLEEFEGAEVSQDDILLHSESLEGLKELTRKVMLKLYNAGIRLNKEKCQFNTTKIKFLGHWFTKDGMMVDTEKTSAIMRLREPKNKKELQRLLGSVNYVSKFIKNASELTAPLRKLLTKDVSYQWEFEQRQAFEKIKQTLSSLPVLKIFDVNDDVTLSVDASSFAMGAVLLQKDQPVMYASKALTETQKLYPQIEKEALAIKFGLFRFHDYVYGKKVTVESDHKPLESIWKKSINRAPPRLKKLILECMPYSPDVIYKKGVDIPLADILSRDVENKKEEDEKNSLEVHLVLDMKLSWFQEIQRETQFDENLGKLKKIIMDGWPDTPKKLDSELKKYFNIRDELSIVEGVVVKSEKIVIPDALQSKAMKVIHEGHFGYENSIRRAKETMFWISMGRDLKEFIDRCSTCQKYSKSQQKQPMIVKPIPTHAFDIVAADIFTLDSENYLLIVDNYSSWFTFEKLKTMEAVEVIKICKKVFSTMGVPNQFHSDNGGQFTAESFKKFAHDWNFSLVTSSPHYPQSNGLAERFVQVAKNMLKKCIEDKTDIEKALLNYRNSERKDLGSPNQRLMSRATRGVIPMDSSKLQPKIVEDVSNKLKRERDNQKKYYDRNAKVYREPKVGNSVIVQHPKTKLWSPGKVISNTNAPRSVKVQMQNGSEYRRNTKMIKPIDDSNNWSDDSDIWFSGDEDFEKERDDVNESHQEPEINEPEVNEPRASTSSSTTTATTRFGRIIKPVNRFGF